MVDAMATTPAQDESPLRLEVRRKIAHALPGLIPFALWFIYHEDPLPLWNVAVVAGVVAALTLVAAIVPRGVRRSASENWLRTCVTYAVPSVFSVALFPGQVEYTCVMLSVLAFGDSAAALGGRLWGRRRLPWNASKTWVGTACFVAIALPIGSLVYWGEARPSVSIAEAVACGSLAAILAAIAESLPTKVDDNLRISIAALLGVILGSALW